MARWIITGLTWFVNKDNDWDFKREDLYSCESQESALSLLSDIEKNKDGRFSDTLKESFDFQIEFRKSFNF